MTLSRDDILAQHPLPDFLRSRGIALRGSGAVLTAHQCPTHEHRPDHWCVDVDTQKGLWCCHDCGTGGTAIDWLMQADNLPIGDAMAKLGGNGAPERAAKWKPYKKPVATYPYVDEGGTLLYRVHREEPKDFWQDRPDPDRPGQFIKGLGDVRRVLFLLPELLVAVKQGRPIFVCEGEKDCLALKIQGFTATTNSGGAGQWRPEFNQLLAGVDVAINQHKDAAGQKRAQRLASSLLQIAKTVRVFEVPDLNGTPCKDPADFFAAGGQAADLDALVWDTPPWRPALDAPAEPSPMPFDLTEEDQAAQAEAAPVKPIAERLAERLFRFEVVPARPEPRFGIGNVPISTPENLTTISAAVKAGKSAFIEGMMAAVLAAGAEGVDTFTITSANPDQAALIHLDTEQSPYDHDSLVRRVLRRAGIERPPPWFLSYCVTGFTPTDARQALFAALNQAREQFGAVHSLFVDGVADLVNDVNDQAECVPFVAELHDAAIQAHCSLVPVIHVNPNSDKTRGHLGSQLERKAESNIRLEKTNEIVTVWAEKNRHAPIFKHHGPSLSWNSEIGMHSSCESGAAERLAEKAESAKPLRDDMFLERPAMRFGDLVEKLKSNLRISDRTAERRVREWSKLEIIEKTVAGLWSPKG